MFKYLTNDQIFQFKYAESNIRIQICGIKYSDSNMWNQIFGFKYGPIRNPFENVGYGQMQDALRARFCFSLLASMKLYLQSIFNKYLQSKLKISDLEFFF